MLWTAALPDFSFFPRPRRGPAKSFTRLLTTFRPSNLSARVRASSPAGSASRPLGGIHVAKTSAAKFIRGSVGRRRSRLAQHFAGAAGVGGNPVLEQDSG